MWTVVTRLKTTRLTVCWIIKTLERHNSYTWLWNHLSHDCWHKIGGTNWNFTRKSNSWTSSVPHLRYRPFFLHLWCCSSIRNKPGVLPGGVQRSFHLYHGLLTRYFSSCRPSLALQLLLRQLRAGVLWNGVVQLAAAPLIWEILQIGIHACLPWWIRKE